MIKRFLIVVFFYLPSLVFACTQQGVVLQVLGSGGPELDDGRSSSSYLIWVDAKARFMIDMGGGSAWRFEQSGAKFEDLQAVAFTHLHIDHVADLPVFVKGSFFTQRDKNLMIFGPSGNDILPAFDIFLDRLFNRQTGAYQYMGSFFDSGSSAAFIFQAQTIATDAKQVNKVYESSLGTLSAIGVMHGLLPALAWRIDVQGKSIIISGDMNGRTDHLLALAKDGDILVAHAAINQQTKGAGSFLHMKPEKIGEIAADSQVNQLILSHFMNRSDNRENEIQLQITKHYNGSIEFASDLSCWPLD